MSTREGTPWEGLRRLVLSSQVPRELFPEPLKGVANPSPTNGVSPTVQDVEKAPALFLEDARRSPAFDFELPLERADCPPEPLDAAPVSLDGASEPVNLALSLKRLLQVVSAALGWSFGPSRTLMRQWRLCSTSSKRHLETAS